jgi:Fe-S cluster assembly protein SufD
MINSATSAVLAQNPFVGLEAHSRGGGHVGPQWFREWRQERWRQFVAEGLPSTKNENWKNTDLSGLAAIPFTLPVSAGPAVLSRADGADLDRADINLVFINGVYQPERLNAGLLPKGMTVRPFSEAWPAGADRFGKIVKQLAARPFETFSGLNEALAADGVWIHLGKNVDVMPLVHVCHLTGGNDRPVLVLPRLLVTAEAGANAAVVVSYRSLPETDGQPVLVNGLTDILLGEGARVFYCADQDSGGHVYQIDTLRAVQAKDSSFDSFSSFTGGRFARNNLNVELADEGASTALYGLSLVQDRQLVDNHTNVAHDAPRCVSNQLYKTVLNGRGRSVFNGRIRVASVAQQTNSYQLNKNLLMSQDCRVNTKPQLEIFADDVKCSHGATVGQMNEDEILYLRTRGISRTDAVGMLARGFVDDLLGRVPLPAVRKKLLVSIDPALAAVTQ